MSPAAAGRSQRSASSPNERKRWPGKAIRNSRVFGVAQKSGKIMKMSFGNAPIELMAGAENAIDVCLGVQPGEHVALIADEISRSVAASLEKALTERGAEFTGLLLEDFGPRPAAASCRARPRRRFPALPAQALVRPSSGEDRNL